MSEKKIDSVRLQNIVQGFGRSAALMSAVELGIFTAIDSGADTLEEVAGACDIHPVNAERLLVMLCAMDLVHLHDGHFTNADDVARFLVEGKGDMKLTLYWTDVICLGQYEIKPDLTGNWEFSCTNVWEASGTFNKFKRADEANGAGRNADGKPVRIHLVAKG